MHAASAGQPPPPPPPPRPPRSALSLPCRALWAGRWRPARPTDLLAALPAEAERLRAGGVRALEFALEVCAVEPAYADPDLWSRVGRILRAAGTAATVHLPAVWVDLAALDDAVWEGGVRSAERALAAAAPLQPLLAAVHPAGYATGAFLRAAPAEVQPELLERLGARVIAALSRLRSGPAGDALAVENLEEAPLPLVADVAAAAGVGLCLDVGHVLSTGGDPVTALAATGGRLAGVHLHDANPPLAGAAVGRAHLPLGSGALQLRAVAEAVAASGFRGPIVLEIEGEEAVEDSASRWLAAAGSVAAEPASGATGEPADRPAAGAPGERAPGGRDP